VRLSARGTVEEIDETDAAGRQRISPQAAQSDPPAAAGGETRFPVGCDFENVEADEELRIGVLDGSEGPGGDDLYAELLADLTSEGFCQRFSAFPLAARKLP
jgi:hypothetical protein